MLEQAKTPKIKRGWLWLSVGVLAFAVLVAPVIRGYSLQSRAGKLIRGYVDDLEASTTNPIRGNFYCLLPSFSEMPKSAELDHAIELLMAASHRFPENSHINLLLGQAYCLKQDYSQAIDALDGFLTQRPDNQLAKAESGFAYVALAQSMSDPQSAQTYRLKSLQSLLEAGFSNDTFTNLGDMSFKQEKYQDALFWYEMSDSFSGLQDTGLFRFALLQLVFHGHSPHADQIKEGMILELAGDLTVEPSDLFVLSTGASVEMKNEVEQTIGVLYFNSQDAGILLNVSEASKFCISVQALDKPPAPTQIGVDMDFENLSILELEDGDGKWVQFDFDVFLDQGIHILSVKLMNDSIEGGIDRNAYFGSMTIELCQGGYVP